MRTRILALLFASGLAYGKLAQGGYIIDSFDTYQSLSYSGVGFQLSEGVVNGSGMVGGQREARIQSWFRDPNNQEATLDMAGGLLVLNVIQGTFASSPNILAWDGTGESVVGLSQLNGLANLDLTGGGATAFVLSNVSSTSDINAQITMHGASGANGGFASVFIPGGTTNGTFFLPFAAFGGQADFTNAGALEFGIDFDLSAPATFSIDEIATDATAVPEPTSLALTSFAGIAMSICASRRRRPQKA